MSTPPVVTTDAAVSPSAPNAAANAASANAASAAATAAEPEPSQRRNLHLLVAAQSLGGASAPIIISLGGLVGQMLSTNTALSTLPVSLYNLGVALSTIPAALIMRRMGRRMAYLLGAVLGLVSGLIAAWGIARSDFVMFCVGTTMAGFYGACVQSYRFAAADMAAPAWRPQAISRVMVGGLIAAVIGPQVVIWTRDALPAAPFAGSFFGQAALALLAVPLIALLRIPPPPAVTATGSGRPLSEIALTPKFIVAVTAGVVTFGLMSFVMTAAPIAMVGCGHTVGEAALGIQWHVLAMFAPSLFTGRLIAAIGKYAMTALGLVLIAAAALMSLGGLDLFNFWGGLVLLGVGWNFGFIGATSIVTDCYRPEERSKVQALNDFLVFGTVALSSFSSGRMLGAAGWDAINLMMFPLVAVVLVMLGGLRWHEGRMAGRPA
ncbi:MFS transporter [Pigmentiphaga litoralis]|uniref:MFS transporter n=1 Tax=Pigmentiphaga litoralis TaxID=516702 RepID=UPI0016741F5A|nr:MFS transporter [Pigmentiphaga litoralis]GGX03568.1 MFS transporter [Pigmentiphaga litoralis]